MEHQKHAPGGPTLLAAAVCGLLWWCWRPSDASLASPSAAVLAGDRFVGRPGDTDAGGLVVAGGPVAVAGEVLARRRVEDVHSFGVEPELGLAARADGAGGIESDDQLGAERLAVELTLELSQLLGVLLRVPLG